MNPKGKKKIRQNKYMGESSKILQNQWNAQVPQKQEIQDDFRTQTFTHKHSLAHIIYVSHDNYIIHVLNIKHYWLQWFIFYFNVLYNVALYCCFVIIDKKITYSLIIYYIQSMLEGSAQTSSGKNESNNQIMKLNHLCTWF